MSENEIDASLDFFEALGICGHHARRHVAEKTDETFKALVKAVEILDRAEKAAHPSSPNCQTCGGTGTAHTMGDETEIGQAPGSSAIVCPECGGSGSSDIRKGSGDG